MDDLQKFLNDFLDVSNRNVLFATMIALLVVLIILISVIRKKKKKKSITTKSDGTEFNENSSEDFSKESPEEIQENSEELQKEIQENSEEPPEESLKDFSKELQEDTSGEDEMEALLEEESDCNESLYSAEMIENFFGDLGKQTIGNAKEVAAEIKKEDEQKREQEEADGHNVSNESEDVHDESEEPIELILHDQISIDDNESCEECCEDDYKEEKEEESIKHTAITLVDGSDRVMVSIGEKFEAKHVKDFTFDVKDEPELTIAMQDGFVFDGRIHFFVSFSEDLAKHVTLKDVTEIAGSKGSYTGYEIKLEILDKGDLEMIDCERTFNYKKVRDAVLIIQLSLK